MKTAKKSVRRYQQRQIQTNENRVNWLELQRLWQVTRPMKSKHWKDITEAVSFGLEEDMMLIKRWRRNASVTSFINTTQDTACLQGDIFSGPCFQTCTKNAVNKQLMNFHLWSTSHLQQTYGQVEQQSHI